MAVYLVVMRMCSYLASMPIVHMVDSKGSIEIRKTEDAEKKRNSKRVCLYVLPKASFKLKTYL
jgi:hypothetical protein